MGRTNWDRVNRENRQRRDLAEEPFGVDYRRLNAKTERETENAPKQAVPDGSKDDPPHRVSVHIDGTDGRWRFACGCGAMQKGKKAKVQKAAALHRRSVMLTEGGPEHPLLAHEDRELRRVSGTSWMTICTCGAEFGPGPKKLVRSEWIAHRLKFEV